MVNKKSFKKVLSVLLVLLTILQLNALFIQNAFAVTPGSVSNPTTIPGTWLQGTGNNSGKWWYKHNDNSYTVNDFEYINGYWYHFDNGGWMETGWKKYSNIWYYFGGTDDGKMKTGWKKLNGYWYFFGVSGAILGQMQTGWVKSPTNNKWYHLDSDGKMEIGWQHIGDYWYYFGSSEDDGIMRTGWQKIAGNWYYFGGADDGKMKTGLQTISGNWYFFETNGHLRNINSGYLPLLDYPANGTDTPLCYFSDDGNACNHHGGCPSSGGCGCKSFGNAVQCMGFARYVYNEYSNMNLTSDDFGDYYRDVRDHTNYADNVNHCEPISSSTDVQSLVYGTKKGTYINFDNGSSGPDHTVIIYSTDSEGITVYDANSDGHCGIKIHYLEYEDISNQYSRIFLIMSHSYLNSNYAVNVNNYYHYYPCSNPGCTARKYEAHYPSEHGSPYICAVCGCNGILV